MQPDSQVARDPLGLCTRLDQNVAAWPLAEHGREPLPTDRDPAVGDQPVVRLDGQLALALVQVQAYDLRVWLAFR